MALVNFEISRREPYLDGRTFGDAGAYERIDGIAHYAVDPAHPANAGIVDLDLAERGPDGLVHFSGDLTLLIPARGNGALLLNVPNRGGQTLTRLFNRAPAPDAPTEHIDPGDGFLFRHGWSLAIVGWQCDVPHPSPRYGLRPPQVPLAARQPRGEMHLRIQPDRDQASFPLTDQHVGPGTHMPIPADLSQPAVLWQRRHPYDEGRVVDAARWRFARDEAGRPVDDAAHVWLDGGFKAGVVYDVVYTPADCPVVGAGLLAVRDAACFVRGPGSPVRPDLVIGEGISQCGRFLRTLAELGLNRGEDGGQAFDGLLVHVAGARRGEFNIRYGQPSVQPTPNAGHLFPFADAPQTDPRTGRNAGLLDRLRQDGALPKIVYTDTAAEYWRGDASLAHTAVDGGGDVALPDNVRRYLFASTQHSPGAPPLGRMSVRGNHGANFLNLLDYVPVYRAALTNLRAWIADGTEPPASAYPRHADGSAATREAVLDRLAALPGLTLAAKDALLSLAPLDLASLPATVTGPAYPCVVSTLDADGNETAGVRMPDVAVPVATHTGFNPRHVDAGGPGQILDYFGSTLPFARDVAARQAAGDPRPSLAERYADRDDYLAKVCQAAEVLVAQRYLLAEDVAVCVEIAAERYDAVVAPR
jgi:hypothetical protein